MWWHWREFCELSHCTGWAPVADTFESVVVVAVLVMEVLEGARWRKSFVSGCGSLVGRLGRSAFAAAACGGEVGKKVHDSQPLWRT